MKTIISTPKTCFHVALSLLLFLGFVQLGQSTAQGTRLQPVQLRDLYSREPGAWTKYAGNPIAGATQAWEGGAFWDAYIMKDGTEYKMWYGGIEPSHIGYAISDDGLVWEKFSGNPVLSPGATGAWDEKGVSEPFVMKDGNTYKMWYWGNNSGNVRQIGYATSPDGVTWTKYAGNPVLPVGGSWESIEVGSPWVLFQNGTYKMWYIGQDTTGQYVTSYATSSDGINWTKYSGNPVLTGTEGTWDVKGVLSSSVLFDGATYRMWYFGKDAAGTNQIGYAKSPDGIHWIKYFNNPVLSMGPSGTWDSSGVTFPKVIFENGVYHMWYQGDINTSNHLGYATAFELNSTYLPFLKK